MDESDIYANIDTPSGYPGTGRSFPKRSERVYANQDIFQTLETTTAGPAPTGSGGVEKRCRNVAVFLGLLCVLLLTGLIVLILRYTKHDSEWRADMDLLQTSNSNLTKERDQLQTSNSNLIKERDQLRETNSNLAEQSNQLQKRLDDVTQMKNDLFKELQDSLGWVYFEGAFYSMSSVEKSWQDSRADCQSRGADLMIINSKEEQDFARRYQTRLWIGLSDRQSEGTWTWVDGTPLTRSFWAPSEPNGIESRDEDCAEIKMYDSKNSWNDDSCEHQRFWICEKKSAL